jgi:hypothetical protein
MFVEMMLALFALVIAGTIFASSSEYAAAIAKGPIGVFAAGVSKFLGALGLPAAIGKSYGAVMLIILAVTILQLVIRFMRVATSEILGDISPIFKNAHVGTIIASLLTLILILTGGGNISGSFWRSQPIDGLHGPVADDSVVDVPGETVWMDLLPDDFYVFHDHGCSPSYRLETFSTSLFGKG